MVPALPESRGRLLARNTLLTLTGHVVPLLVGVATIPLLIDSLGGDRFGALSIVWVLVGYLAIFDFGLSTAVTRFVASALQRDQQDRVRSIFLSAITLQAVLGIIGGLVLALATPTLVDRLLNIPFAIRSDVRGAFYVLALSVPTVLLSGCLRGLLEAAQRFDLVTAVSLPSNVGTFLLPLLASKLGSGLFGVAVVLTASRVLVFVAYTVLAVRSLPARSTSSSASLSRSEMGSLLRFGGWVTVSAVLAPILLYTDRILIASILPVVALTAYTPPFEIVMRSEVIPSSMVRALFPIFSALHDEQARDLRRLYVRSLKFLALLTAPVILMLIAFADQILVVWLGADLAGKATVVFRLLLAGELIGILAPLPGSLLSAQGRPDILSKIYLSSLPVNVLVTWLLLRALELPGAALAFMLRSIIEAGLLLAFAAKVIGRQKDVESELRLLRMILCTAAFGVILTLSRISSSILLESLIAALGACTFALGAWRYVLDADERQFCVSLLHRWIPIGSKAGPA